MGMGVAFSNTTFVETIQRSQRGCRTPSTRCLLISLGIPSAPLVHAADEAIATKIPLNETAKELVENTAAKDHGRL